MPDAAASRLPVVAPDRGLRHEAVTERDQHSDVSEVMTSPLVRGWGGALASAAGPPPPPTASSVLALQRLAGNAAVARAIQRQSPAAPPNASLPPPGASQPSDAEVLYFEGHALRFDRGVLYGVLKKLSDTQGLEGPSGFLNRIKNANLVTLLRGHERPGLYSDILKGLDDAKLQLDKERSDFLAEFEAKANEVALGLLDKSQKTIESELARLGITGDVVRGPEGGTPDFRLSNTEAAAAMRSAAQELIPFAQAAEKTGAESAEALRKLGEAQKDDPFNLLTKQLVEENDARRRRWLEAEDAYDTQRKEKVAAHPALAMYTDEPGASTRLSEFAAKDDRGLANEIGSQARTKLSNIELVRGQVGSKFTVWSQPRLRRVTLDYLKADRPQREAVERKVKEVQRKSEDDKMFFTLLAIGLGLAAAIPTGGSSLIAGIGLVTAAAGASLSLMQLGEQTEQFTLATAANATDFDKAKAISENEPDGLQLALDIVLAVGDVFAAAAAYKTLKGVVKAAKAGDVKAAIRLSATAESAGIRGAAKQKIVGDAIAGLSDEAVEQVAKTMSSGASPEAMQKMIAAAVDAQFKAELQGALQLMDHVVGRIPDTARDLVKSGKVRVLTEASLIEVYGPVRGPKMWTKYSYANGFYSPRNDVVFVRLGNRNEELAGALIHEATHRVGVANPLRGDNFMSEAVAEFAERDFYMTLYADNGPFAGRTIKSPRIQQFLTWSDADLMADIEKRYHAAKKGLDPAKREGFKMPPGTTPEEIVRQVFEDIRADYKATLPTAP